MVFDVESVGLHGEGFAVGYVILDHTGAEAASGLLWTDPLGAQGSAEGQAWVAAHCGPFDCPPFASTRELRDRFWVIWRMWHNEGGEGCVLVADCAWPVEARFLAACVDDDPITREWQGPYPLHDVATLRLAAGLDPLATVERLPNELPQHDPRADARQSARLWLEAMRRVQSVTT
jgi:hypothetical protein